MTHPMPVPPMPPLPPPGAAIEVLRDTVETQARVIRYLLANYESLLKKVEGEVEWKIVWEAGTAKSFAAGEGIPNGMWLITSSFNITVPHGSHTPDPNDLMISYGTTTAVTAGTAIPIEAKVVADEEE